MTCRLVIKRLNHQYKKKKRDRSVYEKNDFKIPYYTSSIEIFPSVGPILLQAKSRLPEKKRCKITDSKNMST